jgi:uncharacterized protein (DUF433 family)
MVSVDKLVTLKRKQGETDEEFAKRWGLTMEEVQKWKRLTDDGKISGKAALAEAT